MSDDKMTASDQRKPDEKPVFPGRVMNEVLKDLLSDLPEENKGALDVQVVLRNGMGMLGAVRRHPRVEDVYIMNAVITGQNGQPAGMADEYFHGHDILRIDLIKAASAGIDLSLPKGFGGIPGISGRRG